MDTAVAEIKRRLLIYRRKQYFRDFLLSLKTLPELTLAKILKRSEKFPIEFPISSVKCENILKHYLQNGVERTVIEGKLLRNTRKAYPIVHESFFEVAIDFLEHKRKFGSTCEQKFYRGMNLLSLINRLLKKRALYFLGATNKFRLLDGYEGAGGWRDVGRKQETEPLVLKNCLSYDEMKLSALISVSSPSYFINQGSRTNGGIVSKDTNDYEEQGVVIGVVGCNCQEYGFLDYQDMIIDPDQNIKKYGYGTIEGEESPGSAGEERQLRKFERRSDFLNILAKYNNKEYCPTWEEVYDIMTIEPDDNENIILSESKRFIRIPEKEDCYFVKDIYIHRVRMAAEIILLEANQRGMNQNRKAFLHIGDFGDLQICQGQEILFLEGFSQAIRNLDLPNISDIFFSSFEECSSCGGIGNNGKIGKNEIIVHFGIRYPHEKIQEYNHHADKKLCVVTYACGANSVPGNEFWIGLCAASGESSQASSSQITELHNPHINPMVTGSNLRVASPTLGILPITEYLESQLTEVISVKRRLFSLLGEVKDLPPDDEDVNHYNYYPYPFKNI